MKQLTDTERLEVATLLLSAEGLSIEYEAKCSELEHDCERNGFHNVPAECEHFDCSTCTMVAHSRKEIDCPYVD